MTSSRRRTWKWFGLTCLAIAVPSAVLYFRNDQSIDPFLSLLATGSAPRPILKRGDGAAGLLVSEVSLRGVMESRGALIAMIQAPDGKSHIVRAGDRFVDGAVKAITLDGLLILQDVNDPLSSERHREVRKRLRSAEETAR